MLHKNGKNDFFLRYVKDSFAFDANIPSAFSAATRTAGALSLEVTYNVSTILSITDDVTSAKLNPYAALTRICRLYLDCFANMSIRACAPLLPQDINVSATSFLFDVPSISS